MNITGKRLALCLLSLTMALLLSASWLYQPVSAQDTGSLEAECVAVVSADGTIAPASLTPQEYCKAVIALVGNEWMKAIKLEATISAVNELNDRLTVVEQAIAAWDEPPDIDALQQQIAVLQQEINAINSKLANVANALQ